MAIKPGQTIEAQVLPSGHNSDSVPAGYTNEGNPKEQLRAASSNSITVSALPALSPQESTLSTTLGTYSTTVPNLPATTLPRPTSPSVPIETASTTTTTTTTATVAPSTRPASRISLDRFSGERGHSVPPTSHSETSPSSSLQSPSTSLQRAARPPSVTIDVSDTVAQEDPPVYMAGNDPQQQPGSTVSVSAALAEDSSVYHRHQHHHSLPFGSDITGLENGMDPGPGTSAYHARLSTLSQQNNDLNHEGTRPASSSLSWKSPPSLWSRERAPGILSSSTDTGTGRDNNDEDIPALLPSTSSAAIPLAMFRRPFLEEDELPEYMSLPEQGLPFTIPAVQSITYTVIPSQGPDDFQQRQEHWDDLNHDGRLSHEDSPIHPNPVSSSSSAAEVRLDIEPSLSPQLVGPGSLLQVPVGSSLLSSPRLHQGSQSGRPWTLEYWVDDTIMYLLYLMDPKHSVTTSLVPRTTETQETRTAPATATMESTPVGLRFMMAPDESTLNGPQFESIAPSAPARTSISSRRSRSRNGNGTSTPGASVLSGLSSAPSRSWQHARQISNHSNSLSPPPVTVSDSLQQMPVPDSGSVAREEAAVIVTMDSVSENRNPMDRHTGDDIGEEEQDNGDSALERVPVGHIRGRPPPLTRRVHGGWPAINSSHVNRPSRQHRLFRRTQPLTVSSSAVAALTPSTSPAPTTEAPVPTSEDDMARSSSMQLPPAIAIQAELESRPTAADPARIASHDDGTGENVGTDSPSSENQIRPALDETGRPSRPSSLAPPGAIVRATLPSVQHVQINDGYAGEEADAVLAHALQATISPTTSVGDPRTVQRNNAYNNALTSEFFKHPSFAFVSAEDPQTWIWWSTHHESNLQRCRQEGPMEEVMMWWRTRVDYRSKENKKKRRLEKQRRKALGLEEENGKATKHLGLVDRWKRYLSLKGSTHHRQSMEITMRVRGLYYAWREEELIAEEAELLMQQEQEQQQQSLSLLSPQQPPESPPPMSFHSDGGQDFTDGVEDQGSQFGMTSIRPHSTTTTPLSPPPPPITPPPHFPAISRKTKSRFFQLVRDDSLVMGQRVKGGPVAEVWITEEPDEDDEYEFHGHSGANISGSSSHHQHHNGEGYASPTYQSVLDSSPSGSAPFYPLVRSDRSSSVTSNNGNTFMTDVSAATGGPVRSSTMTGPLIRPVPSGRSYASSSRYPLSDMDTPAPSFRDAMTTGGGASSGYYGPGNGGHGGGGHASSHRRQRSSVAFSSSRESSIAPTTDDIDHEDGHHHHHHHHHDHHGGSRRTDRGTGDDDSSSSFPKSLRRRKCTIRVMKSLNDETSTFVLSTGPRLPELFDLFTDQSLPGPSRGAFICSVVTFAIIFLIIFISLAFTHREDIGNN